MIVWHDYGVWDGATRALEELAASDPRFQNLQWIRGTSLLVMVRS